ncbi:DUF3616 domain-containing protein [Synechocystis sp. PCC 7509]|uniref:DUF3616 domain-containing protein n=1 Tax=Synechocystis sp. PCC 7509 TaxID=927677 RepID=UPI0002ABC340|nr:DUF3616 domain-containing protein [Synechocystis sp. PCC 7509]
MDYAPVLNKITLKFTGSFQAHRQDISAIRLTSDNYLWLGSDETSTIERLSFIDTQTYANHKHFNVTDFISLPAPADEEIDIEGLAENDYYLWFIGSHSWKRKKVKEDKNDEKNISRLTKVKTEPNRYLIGRIPLIDGELVKSAPHPEKPEIKLTAAKLEITSLGNLLIDALVNDAHLGAFVQATIPGKENGFDIEGLAVHGDRIFLGLRGPVLRGWAVMLEIELEANGTDLLKLKAGQYKKYFINLNGLGIRDLCLQGEDLLILAGPTMDLDGPVRVYKLEKLALLQENVLHKPTQILEIPYGNGNEHAEGMTLITDTETPSILVVYDSPAPERLVGVSDVMADVFKL